MKNLIFLLSPVLVLSLLSSCKDVAVKSIVDGEAAVVRNDSVDMDSITVPVLTPERQEQARQAGILVDYIKVIDDHYVLDISEADALKAGVTREVYQEVLQHVEAGNVMIDEVIKEGTNLTVLPFEGDSLR